MPVHAPTTDRWRRVALPSCFSASQTKIGKQHKLTKEDAMKWFQTKFEGIILNKVRLERMR